MILLWATARQIGSLLLSNCQLRRPSWDWQFCIHHSKSDTFSILSHIFISQLILSSTKFNVVRALFPRVSMFSTSWCIFVGISCFVMRLTNRNGEPSSFSTALKRFARATAVFSWFTVCSCLAVSRAECWWCVLVPVSVIFSLCSVSVKSLASSGALMHYLSKAWGSVVIPVMAPSPLYTLFTCAWSRPMDVTHCV